MVRLFRRFLALLTPLAPLLMPALGQAAAVEPTIAGCPILPADNPWNQRVDQLPVASDSAQTIARIGMTAPVAPGFGAPGDGVSTGMPFAVVSSTTRAVTATFTWAGQSDRGPYPLPSDVPVETGTGDRHVIVVDRSTCTDYELFDASKLADGRGWIAGAGAIFNLRSDRLRPAGWTSADAAGLPILPGLARYNEVKAGAIDHSLRFTAPNTAPRYVYPARHYSEANPLPYAPPMGLRVRLKASVNVSRFPRQARIIARALKTYGMILADNGPAWHISGAPNRRWNNLALDTLRRLHGYNFEVVNTSSAPQPG